MLSLRHHLLLRIARASLAPPPCAPGQGFLPSKPPTLHRLFRRSHTLHTRAHSNTPKHVSRFIGPLKMGVGGRESARQCFCLPALTINRAKRITKSTFVVVCSVGTALLLLHDPTCLDGGWVGRGRARMDWDQNTTV
jgi:hypothetical protein